MFKCKLCEVEYKSLQSLAKHIKGTHKMCSEDYYVNVLGNARGVCVCTLPTKFRNLNVGYNKHCSAKCSYHDPDVTKLRESTNIKRYGNIHPIAVDSVKDKVKCTVTDRYGVDHISKSREIRSKIETTNLIKYGDVCVLGSDLIKSKIRETNIEKYGGHPTTNAIVKAKIITTCMNRYDAPSPLQSNEIKCKIHETNILRYNGNPQSNDIVKERTRDTIIDRYGDHFTRLRDCKEKRRETNVKVYGVEYPSTLPDVKLKTKLTSRERYKTDYPTQSPEVKEKIKNTMLHRHGVTNPLKLDSVKSTVRDTNIKRYGVSAAILLPENITKRKASMRSKIIGMYSDILGKHNCDLIELIDSYNIKYKCNVCNSDMIESYLFINRCRVDRNVTPCSNCVPKVWGTSHIERELFNFVKSIAPDAIENSRKIISPYEVDIYIPSKNIAIEMNGLFYHNEMNVHDGYHLMKTELCEQRDIQLIHIYEDDWNLRQSIVKSRLSAILGVVDHKLYARKCSVSMIDKATADAFMCANHIQGTCRSKYRCGLYYNDILVSVMTFGKSRFNSTEFELLRFANQINTVVVGGASKLFKFFIRRGLVISNIISYADRSWSIGGLYKTLGFDMVSTTIPNYYYVVNGNRESRMRYQKHKLIKAGYDGTNTERDIMLSRKIYRIYDSGSLKFKYNIT